MQLPDNYRAPVSPYTKMWKGIVAEKLVSAELSKRGIKHQLMPHRHPFDIFTEVRDRIDVKSVWRKVKGGIPVYLKAGGVPIDFYIVVGMTEKDVPMFVIPVSMFDKTVGISIRWPKRGKWTWTHNRFDLLRKEG